MSFSKSIYCFCVGSATEKLALEKGFQNVYAAGGNVRNLKEIIIQNFIPMLPTLYKENVKKEFDRNKERYEFLKWGQSSFDNFYLVPPGAGICHQVNLENIAKTIWLKEINKQKR